MENISIVLPCYNHGKYVAEAIRSVLKQTYKDFKLYVFDNGSEDNSWEEIDRFKDKRIKKIRFEKNDLLEVKRQFIKLAKGEYFAIMHADDLWLEGKLQAQMDFFDGNKDESVCVTWSKRIEIDESFNEIEGAGEYYCWPNVPRSEWYRRFLIGENRLSLPSLLCKKSIYIKYFSKIYPYRQVGDVFMWMKILEEANINIIEDILVIQRVHNDADKKNESYPSTLNWARADIELRYSRYQWIDEMSDEAFYKYILNRGDYIKEKVSHLDIMCEKFMFFAFDSRGLINGCENAIRYYNTYFSYKEKGNEFYKYLEKHYNFSREDFYKLEENGTVEYKIAHEFRLELRKHQEILDKNLPLIWRALEHVNLYYSEENIYDRFQFPWHAILPGSRIVIYGGGIVGKCFLGQVANSSYCHVVAVCDRKPQKTGIFMAPVINVSTLVGMDESKYDVILVAIENKKVAMEICQNLKMAGIPESKIKWIDPQKCEG